LEFLGLHAVELHEALIRERPLEPVEELSGRVDLVVVLAVREHRDLVEILGDPWGSPCGWQGVPPERPNRELDQPNREPDPV
jgi:hypothetical protein